LDPCSSAPSDVGKVWTLAHILTKEAAKAQPVLTPSAYTTNWINNWNTIVTINGQTVPPLTGRDVKIAWQRFAGGSTAMPLHKAPFKLLAIANRIDLRAHRPFGEPLGGEIRFVFGIYNPIVNSPPCPSPNPGPNATTMDPNSTIIVEYSPNKSTENQVRDLATRWFSLSSLSGASYLQALQALTEEVIGTGKLLHIRTNEFPLTPGTPPEPDGWNLAEFEPDSTGVLRRSTIKQSPTMALDTGTSALLGNYIWANRDALFANALDFEPFSDTFAPIGTYVVPDKFPGTNTWFRGSINEMGIANDDDFWNAPAPAGADGLTYSQARFRFSLGTCRGCHGRETGTGFNQISSPLDLNGGEAFISSFLSGPVDVEDPILPGFFRTFDEMGRREQDLNGLVNGGPVHLLVLGNNYTTKFLASGKCLDSAGNNSNEGAPSQLFSCHGMGNQRLSLVSVGNSQHSLKYKHSGKCIDVVNGSTSRGAQVVQATCNSSRPSQRLTLFAPSDGFRSVRFQHSNLCLVVRSQGTADGTPIVQDSCPANGDPTRAFTFVE
jgi:hypothetical protein